VADEQRFAIIAYCFMPDHLHVLAEGVVDTSDFTEFVRLFKQQAAFEWKRAAGGRLWQRGYYDHVLREEQDTTAVARYLLENPVRAGLVDSPEEYPFLGSFTMNLEDLLASVQIEDSRVSRRA
jgi:putative transposase